MEIIYTRPSNTYLQPVLYFAKSGTATLSKKAIDFLKDNEAEIRGVLVAKDPNGDWFICLANEDGIGRLYRNKSFQFGHTELMRAFTSKGYTKAVLSEEFKFHEGYKFYKLKPYKP